MAAVSTFILLGLLFMRPLQIWLKARVSPRVWQLNTQSDMQLYESTVNMRVTSPVPLGHRVRFGMQEESGDHGCLYDRMWHALRW